MKLTDRQQTALGTFIKLMRATNTTSQNIHRHLTDAGLTHSQFGVLEALHHLGPLCQGELSSKILKSNANITSVVDALEKRALVVRDRAGDDRRKVIVKLTRPGMALIGELFPRHADVVEKEFSVLTVKEQEELGKLLKKLGIK
jgi:MarR family 2-MHQ and catechol resistance regulon transcriptional repressor